MSGHPLHRFRTLSMLFPQSHKTAKVNKRFFIKLSEDAHFRVPLSGKKTGASSRQKDQSHTIIDLGAGTGTVIFAAARRAYEKKLNIQFIAVEINPFLVFFMQLTRLSHPNKKNISIVRTDMFKPTFVSKIKPVSGNTTIYMYVGLFVMKQLKKQLFQFPKNTRVISYMYEIPQWQTRLIETTKGHHSLFVYKI